MGGAYRHQGLPGAGDLILLVVMETIRGLHTVAKEHIQGIVAALTRYQGKGEQVVFSDALMTNKMSTNPLNSFSFDFMKFPNGLHDLHGKEGDLLLLARMGDSLHLPSESWLQYCNHLSEKHHAAAFQQFQQLLRSHLNLSHINKFT